MKTRVLFILQSPLNKADLKNTYSPKNLISKYFNLNSNTKSNSKYSVLLNTCIVPIRKITDKSHHIVTSDK